MKDILVELGTAQADRLASPDALRAAQPVLALLRLPVLGQGDAGALPEALEALPVAPLPEELARCADWQHPGARLAHLAGRAVARWLLGRVARVNAAVVRIHRASDGAPAVIAPAAAMDWYVSIAHTDGAVLVAVSRRPVGVDLERTDRPLSWERLSKRVYASDGERAAVGGLGEREREDALRTRWVVLEATAKFTRLGLAKLLHARPEVLGGGDAWVVRAQGEQAMSCTVRTCAKAAEGFVVGVGWGDKGSAHCFMLVETDGSCPARFGSLEELVVCVEWHDVQGGGYRVFRDDGCPVNLTVEVPPHVTKSWWTRFLHGGGLFDVIDTLEDATEASRAELREHLVGWLAGPPVEMDADRCARLPLEVLCRWVPE